MFSDHTIEHSWDIDRCTQPLIEQHPDYCIIMAGINDWRLFKPKSFYVGNYRLILNLLIQNGIRPVVMEMPDVDIEYFHGNRKFYRRWMFDALSLLTRVNDSNDSAQDYRDAMRKMLQESGLDDKVLFIPISAWNPEGIDNSPDIYLDDRLHLNLDGYHVMDSCMAYDVIKDYQKRNK
jgi:lysophospholipase L1-like esterase